MQMLNSEGQRVVQLEKSQKKLKKLGIAIGTINLP